MRFVLTHLDTEAPQAGCLPEGPIMQFPVKTRLVGGIKARRTEFAGDCRVVLQHQADGQLFFIFGGVNQVIDRGSRKYARPDVAPGTEVECFF